MLPDNTAATTTPAELGMDVAHSMDVTGAVNAPPSTDVSLYRQDGRRISVPAEDVETFLAEGYTRERRDVPTLAAAIGPLFDAAKAAVLAYVADSQSTGARAGGEDAAARVADVAMQQLVLTWARLRDALQATYPTTEADPTTLSHAVLGALRVDPSQDAHYRAGLAAWDTYRVTHSDVTEFKADLIPLYKTALPATPEQPQETTS